MVEKVEKISREELREIKRVIGEAFVTNELFHEFGSISDRRELVMKYMDAYVQCVYESGALYRTKDGQGYIGLALSDAEPVFPKLKMLFRMLFGIPMKTLKRYMNHVKQITGANEKYAKHRHVEVLMVCVSKESQGKGIARKLVEFAQQMAENANVPLLFDTDMPEYASMYQHMGCTLYNKVTADNGVCRYCLVWRRENGTEI